MGEGESGEVNRLVGGERRADRLVGAAGQSVGRLNRGVVSGSACGRPGVIADAPGSSPGARRIGDDQLQPPTQR